jgi:hypothetical protein
MKMNATQWVATGKTTTLKGKALGTNKETLKEVKGKLNKLAETEKIKAGETFRVSLLQEDKVCGAWTMKAKIKKVKIATAKKALKKVAKAKTATVAAKA